MELCFPDTHFASGDRRARRSRGDPTIAPCDQEL